MSENQAREGVKPALWLLISTGALSLVGLAISTYLTIAHYQGTQVLACSDTGVINCAKVTTSPQSVFLGIPVAVLGLAYYVVALAVYSPWAWLTRDRRIVMGRVIFSIAGVLFILWLITAELLIIKNICLWCTGVHIVTFLLFVITVTTAPALLGTADPAEVN
jgi:uncharacterized membrane protein